jgi:hypothetical protein
MSQVGGNIQLLCVQALDIGGPATAHDRMKQSNQLQQARSGARAHEMFGVAVDAEDGR